jgi:hypothetical protein
VICWLKSFEKAIMDALSNYPITISQIHEKIKEEIDIRRYRLRHFLDSMVSAAKISEAYIRGEKVYYIQK